MDPLKKANPHRSSRSALRRGIVRPNVQNIVKALPQTPKFVQQSVTSDRVNWETWRIAS